MTTNRDMEDGPPTFFAQAERAAPKELEGLCAAVSALSGDAARQMVLAAARGDIDGLQQMLGAWESRPRK